MTSQSTQRVKVKEQSILSFFLPLGFSASLVTLSHVIINSTLARADDAEATIAAYAIAMSIFSIAERPAVLLRQTCSTLVQDKVSFRSVGWIAAFFLAFALLFGFIIAYTPPGAYLIGVVFNADERLVDVILPAYRILMFVTIFSAIRCLYQGIIIRQMRTKWLTIGMIVRLTTMYLLSLYFIHIHHMIDGRAGALIFLSGMMVEALVGYLEGRKIAGRLPERVEGSAITSPRDVIPFYKPLVYSAFIGVIISPSINAMLGKTAHIELAISSYAIALSLAQLMTSFFSYTHQIVIHFYRIDAAKVIRFSLGANMIPGLLIGIIAFTPVGPLVMEQGMGVRGALLDESLNVLRIFVVFSLTIPWIDYCHGLFMLRQRTKVMVWSQATNVATTLVVLIPLALLLPSWNGTIGALAQCAGMTLELSVLVVLLFRLRRKDEALTGE